MSGMNVNTGAAIANDDHLLQSIIDILTTPIGSRVMRREYGSNLPNLIDQPITPGLFARIVAASAEALDRWEPRLKLLKVKPYEISPGRIALDMSLIKKDGSPLEFAVQIAPPAKAPSNEVTPLPTGEKPTNIEAGI
jgi:phage baseplate assembly protein W